jgi:hypothetical protein
MPWTYDPKFNDNLHLFHIYPYAFPSYSPLPFKINVTRASSYFLTLNIFLTHAFLKVYHFILVALNFITSGKWGIYFPRTPFLWYKDLNSGPTPWAILPAPFCEGFFRDRVLWNYICLGWLRTKILLISASWVARITGMSYQHLALGPFKMKCYIVVYNYNLD